MMASADARKLSRTGPVRALVTGAAGFVGRWLLDAMKRDGMQLFAMATTEQQGQDGDVAEWIYGDIRDEGYLGSAVQRAQADVIIHLAAISHLPTAAADPGSAWDVNVTSTARLLSSVVRERERGVPDPVVLIVGSAEQYGRHGVEHSDALETPIVESAPQEPRTVYAATKCAQEMLAMQYWRAEGLKVVAVRSFNHSGRGQEPRFLLPALVGRALALRKSSANSPMKVGNTTPVRDFLHVSDVVAAYISLCKKGVAGEVYNVSSGRGYSVSDVLDRVLDRVGTDAPIVEDPALVRDVDVPYLVGNSDKLQHATGWHVTQSLDDIIDDLINAATH